MDRDYPSRPIIGILAMVRRGSRFLLVRRAKPPNSGYWGFPGGVQELGETIFDAALRELAEETGVKAAQPQVFTALDAVERDEDNRIRYHYTLIVVALEWQSGEGEPGDDADALGWFGLEDVETLAALPSIGTLMLQALGA
jgi:8-oxo-dGTP diphosphatase